MQKIKIGISTGDLNGIGPEVIIRTFSNPSIMKYCIPVIYGSTKVMAYYKNIVETDFTFIGVKNAENSSGSKVNVVNCMDEDVKITIGSPTEQSGKFAIACIEKMMEDVNNNLLDAVITAPINKHAMKLAGWKYRGHTEYFADVFNEDKTMMFMVSDNIKVALVTDHVPIKDVASRISKELILKRIYSLEKSLIQDFGIEKPTIAVLGLNPHAGDEGTIGEEDDTIVRPAILEAKKAGLLVFGPYPADGFFGSGQYNKFDGILAMYHDQGLIPFKTLSFGKGVNYTAEIPVIRTSPDHGTAYDIAGKNEADISSFREAIYATIDITRNKKAFEKNGANPLKKKPKREQRASE